jgi:Flp pilus assembly protein TadD
LQRADAVFGEIERVARDSYHQRWHDVRAGNALAQCLNGWAYALATLLAPKQRDPARAVILAQEAVDLAPKYGVYWRTLGVAHYRAGNWTAARRALEKSIELGFRKGSCLFFLAMTYWQLDEKAKARDWHDKAVKWMDGNMPTNAELRRFRTEAAKLLEVKEVK